MFSSTLYLFCVYFLISARGSQIVVTLGKTALLTHINMSILMSFILILSGTFSNPYGMFQDTTGNVYVADYGDQVIRKINPNTGVVTIVAGNF